MDIHKLIALSDFCAGHGISTAFVMEWREYGLVDLVQERDEFFLPETQLDKAEKIVRLYTDLDINLEGIEVITRLLDRMEAMELEMARLRNRLDRFQ